ncbi:MAG: FtsW/RodA/SpoVE family cell cycle protein, partial [Oscillospiraceae bacterium]|nr:FtsW/RodA/SpoVE family cell cycle protein [Oscillospiraceae bacterium]
MAAEYDFPGVFGKEKKAAEEPKVRELRDYRESRFINRGRIDLPVLVLTILILTVGVITVFSASFARSYYETGNAAGVFLRQLFFAVVGVGVMMFASRVKPKTIRKYSKLLMIVSVFLLFMVLVIGIIGGGSRRCINLGFTTFQPSEITKLAVILYF